MNTRPRRLHCLYRHTTLADIWTMTPSSFHDDRTRTSYRADGLCDTGDTDDILTHLPSLAAQAQGCYLTHEDRCRLHKVLQMSLRAATSLRICGVAPASGAVIRLAADPAFELQMKRPLAQHL